LVESRLSHFGPCHQELCHTELPTVSDMVQLAYMADIFLQRSSSLDFRRSGLSTDSRHASSLWSESQQSPLTDSLFLNQELDDLHLLNLELERKYEILKAHHETLWFLLSLSFIAWYKLTKGFEGCI